MTGRLDAAACAAALAALPGMGPVTLRRLLDGADPTEAWAAVVAGEVERPLGRGPSPAVPWQHLASTTDVAAQWSAWSSSGTTVTWWGGAAYPARLVGDPEPPGVLFVAGDLSRLAGPVVAVVGTRRCTPDGRSSAYHLGRELAAAGVCVVSGLALGIDGAAHQGALDAPPPTAGGPGSTVGVAASGVDVAYPVRHRALWKAVVSSGAVISETPPGRPAQAWRFPTRNRIIAGLADVVVVVESHSGGGSMLTAEAALDRGVDVRAVPGPVASPASAGTNQLLHDGAAPVRDATDVLDGLGLLVDRPPRRPGRRPVPPPPDRGGTPALPGRPSPPPDQGRAPAPHPSEATGRATLDQEAPGPARAPATESPPRVVPAGIDAEVLNAVGWRPTSAGRVVERSAHRIGEVMAALDRLEAAGLVRDDSGWWTRVG